MNIAALRGVDLRFNDSEFVCVLGPSGCGKTTLLNIVGGLDQYTSGDLVINGMSTKTFRDSDWDSYRNHSVGFVFQTYNLIPHQTVLSNVELALTLSGVSKSDRTQRAKDVIEQVGLSDQLYKKPNQLSGGQMQRVAIARALVNDPEILLADEPTGALDSETSVQIMEILKEISKDRLIIMVTHNPDLADKYSTRIVRLLDGNVISDSSPLTGTADQPVKNDKSARLSMSFFMALSLSLNNLLTKKTRTLLTAFAGSIGIIGIALILALSNGLQEYIARVEEETLSLYPIIINREEFDFLGMMLQPPDINVPGGGGRQRQPDRIYVSSMMGAVINAMTAAVHTNDLVRFSTQLEYDADILSPLVTAIAFGYNIEPNLYMQSESGEFFPVNPNPVFEMFGVADGIGGSFDNPMMAMGGVQVWTELIDNRTFLETQYDLIAGRWPEEASDVVLIVGGGNGITDFVLFSLGLRGPEYIREMQQSLMQGTAFEVERGLSFSFDEILDLRYRLVVPADRFVQADGGWADYSHNFAHMQNVFENALEINIVGILRTNPNAIATSQSGIIGYTSALTRYVIGRTNETDIVQRQRANPDIDVFTGLRFGEVGFSTFEENLVILGAADLSNPSSIRIYPSGFENKAAISEYIAAYNEMVGDNYMITYTDIIGLLLSSVTTVISAVSYMLIAFVSISLVVSSIMIGIITYISVLERTKEIGILRSIGASKRDIGRVFNAETLIIGFTAGVLGILVTLLLTIPANALIYRFAEINNVALLPVTGAVVLIVISMLLSLVAGLIPSRVAANKDPVVALRTE